jgi:hypothetical protein
MGCRNGLGLHGQLLEVLCKDVQGDIIRENNLGARPAHFGCSMITIQIPLYQSCYRQAWLADTQRNPLVSRSGTIKSCLCRLLERDGPAPSLRIE